jgi:hypothetical protein
VASLGAWGIDDVQAGTRTLYEIIDELPREHRSPAAVKTLDTVVQELGRTEENLDDALERLERRPIPVGGKQVLNELKVRAGWPAWITSASRPRPRSSQWRHSTGASWALPYCSA